MHVSNRNEELRQMQRATSQKKQRKKKAPSLSVTLIGHLCVVTINN